MRILSTILLIAIMSTLLLNPWQLRAININPDGLAIEIMKNVAKITNTKDISREIMGLKSATNFIANLPVK